MQRYLQLAQSSGKLTAQAEACCSLGVLYNQQNDYASAVQYLERYFELARSIGDRQLIDKVCPFALRGRSLPSCIWPPASCQREARRELTRSVVRSSC